MEHHLDVCGLEPPQPMVEILAKLAEIPDGDVLVVTHFREPVPLYAYLDEGGYRHSIERVGEASYRLKVWRPHGD